MQRDTHLVFYILSISREVDAKMRPNASVALILSVIITKNSSNPLPPKAKTSKIETQKPHELK